MADEVKTTLGFWVGFWIGIAGGSLIFGVSIVGQGLWEGGRYWGYQQCLQEADHG